MLAIPSSTQPVMKLNIKHFNMNIKNKRLLISVATMSLLLSSCGASTPSHKHDWGKATYTWTSDYSSCTAERVCLTDSTHIEKETVDSTTKTVNQATCENDGLGNYVATFTNPDFETQYHEYTIPHLGHDYQFDSFVWEGYTAKAKYVCSRDTSHIKYHEAEVTSEVTTSPTCTNTGVKTYTATYLEYKDTKTEVLSSLGHQWGEPTYELNGDSEMTAKRVCLRDSSHIEEETVTGAYEVVTPATEEATGLGRYTFTFTNTAFTTKTHDVVLDKITVYSKPTFSDDGKTVTYGVYPQTRIADEDLIFKLEEDADWIDSGLYQYEDEYYGKVYCKPYGEDCKFDDGATITKYSNYWFKYEPITWTVLSSNNNEYLLLSNVLLDTCKYSSANNNNYKNSTIRSWLNDEFLERAFMYGNSYIKTTLVDNSAATTASANNQYACDNTEDKVFLLSYKDYVNAEYGFATSGTSYSSTRYCKTTDYARANGACISTSGDTLNNGLYWTRSPNSGNIHYASYIRQDGVIGYDNNVSYEYLCVRPAITIKID